VAVAVGQFHNLGTEVEVKRDIKVQGKVQMKMIIPKEDKVKRLLLLQHNT
jgi:hypothetical protein